MPTSATARKLSKGTTLWYSTLAAPTTWIRVGGVISINGKKSRAIVNGTELSQIPDTLPGGDVEEDYFFDVQYPGTKKNEPVSVECNLTKGGYAALYDMYSADTLANWRILFRDGDSVQGKAYVNDIAEDVKENELVKMPFSLLPQDRFLWVDGA